MEKNSLTARIKSILAYSLIGRGIFVSICWLAIWEVGRLLEYIDHASIWFPAAGLTYAAMLIAGTRAVIPVAFSATLITYIVAQDFNPQLSPLQLVIAGLSFSAAHITPYYIGTRLIRRMAMSARFTVPQVIVTFLVSSALVTLATTFLVIEALIANGLMSSDDVASTWLPFWIGDLAGVVVMGPLFCSIISKVYPNPRLDLSRYVGHEQVVVSHDYLLKMSVTLALLTACMLLTFFVGHQHSAFAIFFLVIPHMWIASTESAFLNTLSLAISSCLIAFWVSTLGLIEYAMVYQFAINVVAANALFGIALPTLAADNRELRRRIKTDTLTQTASREYLIKRAEFEISRSQSERSNLSMIIFDVDHFKHINDNFGHAKGDDALRIISRTAKLLLRPSDLLGRFGGDEFVAILPNTNLSSAHQIASRIANEISSMSLGDHSLTSSFGIAQLHSGEDFGQLFERADKALFEAKKQGRNRIVESQQPA